MNTLQNMKKLNKNVIVATILVLSAVILRIIFNKLQMWNFSPITAMALFAGYAYHDKRFSFIIPLSAMFISDLIIGLHDGMLVVYVALSMATLIGIYVSGKQVAQILAGSIISSVLFYLVTNLVIWYGPELYAQNWDGQIQSYMAALPFFQSSLVSDLIFTAIFISAFELIRRGETATERA